MQTLSREQVLEQLDAMRKQEAYVLEQLALTRGAVQMLEHLLSLFDDDSGGTQDAPEETRD